jgi:hypothetical protein
MANAIESLFTIESPLQRLQTQAPDSLDNPDLIFQ